MTNTNLVVESYWTEPENFYMVEADYLAKDANMADVQNKDLKDKDTAPKVLKTLVREYFNQGRKILEKESYVNYSRHSLSKGIFTSLALCMVICASSLTVAAEGNNKAERNELESSKYAVDNSGKNIRDRNRNTYTAQDQALLGDDNELLAEIRSKITERSDLSTNARNVKILVQHNTITLRGPVNSVQERDWIETTVKTSTSDEYTINNEIEVKPG